MHHMLLNHVLSKHPPKKQGEMEAVVKHASVQCTMTEQGNPTFSIVDTGAERNRSVEQTAGVQHARVTAKYM